MKRSMLLAILGCGVAFAGFATALDSRQSTATAASATADIHTVLDDQRAAWNRGDVDAFMKGYWNSPALSFAGTSGITRGGHLSWNDTARTIPTRPRWAIWIFPTSKFAC